MQSDFISVPSAYVSSYLYISVNISDDFVKLWWTISVRNYPDMPTTYKYGKL